jgi:outer membrane biosynthesis protein TonB
MIKVKLRKTKHFFESEDADFMISKNEEKELPTRVLRSYHIKNYLLNGHLKLTEGELLINVKHSKLLFSAEFPDIAYGLEFGQFYRRNLDMNTVDWFHHMEETVPPDIVKKLQGEELPVEKLPVDELPVEEPVKEDDTDEDTEDDTEEVEEVESEEVETVETVEEVDTEEDTKDTEDTESEEVKEVEEVEEVEEDFKETKELEDLTKAELIEVAKEADIEVSNKDSKAEILDKIKKF